LFIYPRPVSALTGAGVANAFTALVMLLIEEDYELL
jgi:hypothetical protein